MPHLLEDLRFAVRGSRRAPMFAVVAILSLGVAIGAVTAMFRIVDALDIRGLRYPDAERLVTVRGVAGPKSLMPGRNGAIWTNALFNLRERTRAYDALEAVSLSPKRRTVGDVTESIRFEPVTSGFFKLFGVQPVIGRDFLDSDTLPGAARVVVLSSKYWHKAFGADTGVIGKQLQLADEGRRAGEASYVVVGVMPPSFQWRGRSDMWSVLQGRRDSSRYAEVVGRLRPGATLAAAQREAEALALDVLLERGRREGVGLRVAPLRGLLVGEHVGNGRFALLGVAAFVLLLAIVNVANLILARSAARRTELAIRAALGATRARMLQLAVIEGLCLTVPASALGMALGALGADITARKLEMAQLDLAAAGSDAALFALAVGVVVALLIGLIPVVMSTPRTGSPLVASGGDRAVARSLGRTQQLLIGAEVALAVVLLSGAGLLGRALLRALDQDVGMDARHVVSLNPYDNRVMTAPGAAQAMLPEAVARVSAMPGVEGIAALGWGRNRGVRAEGREPPPMMERPGTMVVTPEFFSVMRLHILRGRQFLATDVASADAVTIVSQTAARALWGTEDVLGKRLAFLPDDSVNAWNWATVVGVAHNAGLLPAAEGVRAVVYRPFAQADPSFLGMLVRTNPKRAPTFDAWRRLMRQMRGAAVAETDVSSLEGFVDPIVARPRFNAVATGTLALFGLFLAALGIYGIVAFSVASRTREMGIRLALGASTAHVIRTTTGVTALAALVGLGLGLVASGALTRVLRAMLHGVNPLDPAVFALVATVLLVVLAIASYLPARRATRVDPVDVLRAE